MTLPDLLIDARRADLAAKRLFFVSLSTGLGRRKAESIYRQHIMARTGGNEDRSEYAARPKEGIDAYVQAAEALIASMKRSGFDPLQPVPIGSNGLLRNGAHRLACASVLSIPVSTSQEISEGWPWDWKSVAGALSKNDQLRLLRAAFDLAPSRSVPFILWGPVVDRWDDIIASIDEAMPVQGYVDLAFTSRQRPAFDSLVYDIYSYAAESLKDGLGFIDRKTATLAEWPAFFRIGCALAPVERSGDYRSLSVDLKKALRTAHADKAPAEQFITAHFADDPVEACHMASTLFNPESLAVLRHRTTAQPRARFVEWLDNYRFDVKNEGLSSEDCCIVGSSILETVGIRQTTDIDFTIRNELRERYGSWITHLPNGSDIVTENYHRGVEHPYTDSQIIDTPGLHVRFRGMKIVTPWIVRDRKSFSARPKDLLDVELIDESARWISELAADWS